MSTPAAIAGNSNGVAQVLSISVTIPRSRVSAQIPGTSCTSMVIEPGQCLGKGPLRGSSLKSVAMHAKTRPARFHVGDAVEQHGRRAFDRRVYQSPAPFLSTAAFDQPGRRPFVAAAHAALMAAPAA